MKGDFGVFDGVELLAEFSDDVSADEYRRDALQLDQAFPCSEYDDLQVYEVPENYATWYRLYTGLCRLRNQELAVTRCVQRLRAAQRERAEARRAA